MQVGGYSVAGDLNPELAAMMLPVAAEERERREQFWGKETPEERERIAELRELLGERPERAALRSLADLIDTWKRELLPEMRDWVDRKRKQFIHDRRKGLPADTLYLVQREWQERYAELINMEAACGLTDVANNEIASEIWRRMHADLEKWNTSVEWPWEQVSLTQSPVACRAAMEATEGRKAVSWGRQVDSATGTLF